MTTVLDSRHSADAIVAYVSEAVATLPNPVLTTLRYFREEYQAHIAGH
jgi:hypothetical protein